MESHPQNPEIRNNPENFHPCIQQENGPGPIAQSVVSRIADQGVVSLIPARSHTFIEIDCEIFSTVILLLPLTQGELVSVTSEVLVNCLVKHAQEKCG